MATLVLLTTDHPRSSVASLLKRVFVICVAIVWFRQAVTALQWLGIALTFFGLYLYHGAKGDVERGEKERRGVEARREGALPLTREEEKEMALAARAADRTPTPAQLLMNFGAAPIGASGEENATSAFSRPIAAPRTVSQQTHRGAGLIIDLPHKPAPGGERDPYPSPPASIDSPPLTAQLVSVHA